MRPFQRVTTAITTMITTLAATTLAVTMTAAAIGVVGVIAIGVATAPTVAAAPAAGPLAQLGDRSPLVKSMQQALINAGVNVAGGADGIFGRGTQTALTTFQQRIGLPATGVLDEPTAVALGMRPRTPLLTIGSSGKAVATVQQQLAAVGITVRGGADGSYGTATATAVSTFQHNKGLPISGNVDAATAAILANAAASSPAAPTPATPTPATPTPAVTSSGSPQPGQSGAAVLTLQRNLMAVGARPKGGADGVYGPATVSAVKTFQRWIGVKVTGVLDTASLTLLQSTAAEATTPKITLAHFPLPPTCAFWDTWLAPRSGGRKHIGVDMAARRGTPVYAVADGVISKKTWAIPNSMTSNALRVRMDDGTYFFYAHLDGFAKGISVGVPVRAGDLIGYVGSTGNSSVPHLHFEVHPQGGAPVNPYPIVKAASDC